MPKKARTAKTVKGKDVNYTIPGLLAIFGIVLLTVLYFTPNIAQKASSNLGGSAISTGNVDTTQSPSTCQVQSRCVGSQLTHQQADCKIYTAFCQYGCLERPDGAICG